MIAPTKPSTSATRRAGKIRTIAITSRLEIPAAARARAASGYVPDEPNLYPKLSGRELLRFVGDLYGLDRERVERRIDELLRLFDLSE
ncbi:MAG TPA: hypothetical protein VF498_17560, partial [Anaerolineales bacterium]